MPEVYTICSDDDNSVTTVNAVKRARSTSEEIITKKESISENQMIQHIQPDTLMTRNVVFSSERDEFSLFQGIDFCCKPRRLTLVEQMVTGDRVNNFVSNKLEERKARHARLKAKNIVFRTTGPTSEAIFLTAEKFADPAVKKNEMEPPHPGVIIDRKSRFEAFCAFSHGLTADDVKDLAAELREDADVEKATHVISAYRILDNGVVEEDNDDDGENFASSKLLQLLRDHSLIGCVVFVVRWYGGVLLGPVRFRHIVVAAERCLWANRIVKRTLHNKQF